MITVCHIMLRDSVHVMCIVYTWKGVLYTCMVCNVIIWWYCELHFIRFVFLFDVYYVRYTGKGIGTRVITSGTGCVLRREILSSVHRGLHVTDIMLYVYYRSSLLTIYISLYTRKGVQYMKSVQTAFNILYFLCCDVIINPVYFISTLTVRHGSTQHL